MDTMEMVYVGRTEDFDDDRRRKVTLGDTDVIVLRYEGEFHAFENRCAHMGGPVGEGIVICRVEGVLAEDRAYIGERFNEDIPQLVCPWHGWEYDLRTGRCAVDPSLRVKKYPVHLEDGAVYLQMGVA